MEPHRLYCNYSYIINYNDLNTIKKILTSTLHSHLCTLICKTKRIPGFCAFAMLGLVHIQEHLHTQNCRTIPLQIYGLVLQFFVMCVYVFLKWTMLLLQKHGYGKISFFYESVYIIHYACLHNIYLEYLVLDEEKISLHFAS